MSDNRARPNLATVPVILLSLCAAGALQTQYPRRTYHPISISEMAAEDPAHWRKLHTHVEVTGYVTYIKEEEDGDLHVRLCDVPVQGMNREHCIVAEFIPLIRPGDSANHLRRGMEIRVQGISRYDAERNHLWWEIHPVESVEILNGN